MANNDLDKLIDKYAWNALQIQQLRLAKKHNVSLEYFTPQYDWEQLREIRLALEDGLDPSFLLDKHINSDSMKYTREKVYESSGLFREKAKHKKQRRIISLGVFIGILIFFSILGLWKKDFIISMVYDIKLEMKNDRKTIGLSEIKNFHFIDLVNTYSKDCELIIPNEDISKVGEYSLRYTIKNESKSLTKNVILIVVDDVEPIINLKQTRVELDYGENIDLQSFIKDCNDNVDGNIKDRVIIDGTINNKKVGKQEIIYSVTDSAGNKATQKFIVEVKQKRETNTSTKSTTPTNQNPSSSSSSSSKVKVSAKNKNFLFSQYGDASATQKVAVQYGNSVLNSRKANRFECNPITDENGIYIGFEVKFN